jgi:hypothetical protein
MSAGKDEGVCATSPEFSEAIEAVEPSVGLSAKRESISDIFTIVRLVVCGCICGAVVANKIQICSGFALISDGYQVGNTVLI